MQLFRIILKFYRCDGHDLSVNIHLRLILSLSFHKLNLVIYQVVLPPNGITSEYLVSATSFILC